MIKNKYLTQIDNFEETDFEQSYKFQMPERQQISHRICNI